MTICKFFHLLALVLIAPAIASAQTAKPDAPPVRPTLPQDHEYQRVLYKHLQTLTEQDLTHGVSAPLKTESTNIDPEYLYRNHILTMMNQPLVGTKRGYPAINAPAKLFLLSKIESPQGVQLPPVWPETLIPFVQWDHPGNPYFNNRALKLRAFVTATVMMEMADDHFTKNPAAGRGDKFSYQLVWVGLPYPGFKNELPPEVQRAYEAGLKRMSERVMAWGIRGEETHADLTAPFGLACVARAINDPAFSKAVEDWSRPLFTDPRYFSPAGYWLLRGGPDIPYNGHANFFAVSTGLATQWPFVREAVERSYRLRAHLILPEPDGKFTGPSHFNSRVSGPASVDQWSWNGARDVAASMLTDEAVHLVKTPPAEMLKDATARCAQNFAFHIAENGFDMGRPVRNEEIRTFPWSLRVWMSYNFPGSVNPGHEFYPAGAFAHRQELEQQNSPWLKSPFERGETFIRDFSKEFVVTRQRGFAAILHTGTVGSQDPADGMLQFKGPMGLSGGQLSAFWTPAAGTVLLGQRGGMSREKSFDLVEAWRTWPNHSVSGINSEGVFFTSARIQKPDASVEIQGNTAAVKVSGVIPAAIVGQDRTIAGKYQYARSFQIDDRGVHVETSVTGDGRETAAELYEVLPVYLRDPQFQPQAVPTTIELQVDGQWVAATTDFVEKVAAIRLKRFTGAVIATFDRPRRVKLSPAEWADTYLSRAMSRNILIDLLENSDQPTMLTAVKQVGYRIEPAP